ncbi:hypothetical protein JQ615_41135 [Bradyrhizobium jicamae]|uniref:Uncharacterized protein n=1 Tax=Bradyrhizobium jicamae TaxID=280332 RepID=A0ABS5FY67_9BRAD|nr:hypothetical protein [Bradyrhizobium jicamae]MBR0801748.1 hypothetical protein [Bradyrhizobium jicamae]MBR0939398.1 hypothetical protein [Bradyrhizobium jicamae]
MSDRLPLIYNFDDRLFYAEDNVDEVFRVRGIGHFMALEICKSIVDERPCLIRRAGDTFRATAVHQTSAEVFDLIVRRSRLDIVS